METPSISPASSETPSISPASSETPSISPASSETPSISPASSETPSISPASSETPSISPASSETSPIIYGRIPYVSRGDEEFLHIMHLPPGSDGVEYFRKESDLHRRWENCEKHPRHEEFIAVSDFKREMLDENYRDNVTWYFLKAVIDLTVRLTVNHISDRRPDGYRNQDVTGMGFSQVGSGMVTGTHRRFAARAEEKCPCRACRQSLHNARTGWGGFIVETANHVVFDQAETEHASCDLWFDSDQDSNRCFKLIGAEVLDSQIDEDYCVMLCVTHDPNVYKMIEVRLEHFRSMTDSLLDKYRNCDSVAELSNIPVICISHPHGMSKHVTKGVMKDKDENSPYKWSYTTPTCPGSSGAPVITLGRYGLRSTHSGTNSRGENECGFKGHRRYGCPIDAQEHSPPRSLNY